MSLIDSSVNNPVYVAAITASEGLRQSDEQAATLTFGNRAGDEPVTTFNSAMQAAVIRDLVRRVAAANLYGGDPMPWIHGLKCLGRDAYGN